jgi:hypothetical protein
MRRRQQSFDFPLSLEELEKRDSSGVRAAAELFICREFGIPYYYGMSRLASMASSNIQQFLSLASGLFEEIAAAALMKRESNLLPPRQEEILKNLIERRWKAIPQHVMNGYKVRALLEAIGRFCEWATDQPNAPYAPGVTGIAISMADRDKLRDKSFLDRNPRLSDLASVISTSLANNLLEASVDHLNKGQRWMLLSLNRMLCVRFQLPLQYSGWRPKSLKELLVWLDRGFTAPKNSRGLFDA